MNKKKLYILPLLLVISMLCTAIAAPISFAEGDVPSTETLTLAKSTHESCIDTGSIEFADHTYSFKNSSDILSTGQILGKSVTDFEWEFDYWCDDPAWTNECFMFHCNSEGIFEGDTYCLKIRGINHGNGPALYKNGDYSKALGEYKWPSNLGTKTWDNAIYHVKITVKDNLCKVWFYLASDPAADPVITVDLGSSEPTSGDFKIQGYASKMNLMHMVIRTDDKHYYFDPSDVPSSQNPGDGSSDSGNESSDSNQSNNNSSANNNNQKQQLLKLTKSTHESCIDTGSIEFADHTYSFKNSNDILGTGPILGKAVTDFEWEFDYWCDDPAWTQERFMFHSNSEGIFEEDSYCLEIRGINHGNGPALYKNGDYSNALGEYKWPSNLGTKTWDNAIYHVKITVKDNLCKVWFYLTSAPAKDPVITVDLGSSEPTSGDFKIQGYSSKMNLMNIVIRTADCTYYFDEYNMTEDMTSVIPATGDSGSYAVFMLFLLSAVTATAALLRLKKKS